MNLLPDVTEILDDPEVGGGQSFTVLRKTLVRTYGGDTEQVETFQATGNVQSESEASLNQNADEDKLEERITIRSVFNFQTGKNSSTSLLMPDEILYEGETYRVTGVTNWSMWGFTIAQAVKMRG